MFTQITRKYYFLIYFFLYLAVLVPCRYQQPDFGLIRPDRWNFFLLTPMKIPKKSSNLNNKISHLSLLSKVTYVSGTSQGHMTKLTLIDPLHHTEAES